MKTSSILAIVFGILSLTSVGAQAQNYVLESKVALLGTITTQGTEVTTTARNGTEVKRLQVVVKPFTNREILATMQTRGLIGTSVSGWTLVYLQDASANGGVYATKSGVLPVAVPADLLTLPVYSHNLQTGTETKNPNGNTFVGVTEIALATASVHGKPVSGLASNGVRTLSVTIQGTPYLIDTVTSMMNFTGGGAGATGTEIVKGSISVGNMKVSTLTTLP